MRKLVIGVFLIALAVNLWAGFLSGISKPMESDAFYYLDIAKNMAAGKGYVLTHGFWPDQPTMSRSPAWPAVVAAALRLGSIEQRAESREQESGGSSQRSVNSEQQEKAESGKLKAEITRLDHSMIRGEARGQRLEDSVGEYRIDESTNHRLSSDAVMRVICLLLNALNALLVVLLALRIGASRRQSIFAGLLYLFYPTALYLAVGGASEILFITLLLGGTLLLMRGCVGNSVSQEGRVAAFPFPSPPISAFNFQLSAFLLLGCASLVRANFVIWIGVFGVVVAWSMGIREEIPKYPNTQIPKDGGRKTEDRGQGAVSQQSITSTSGAPVRRFALCSLLSALCFLAPSLLWAVRNYSVCGEFPVLSTLRGQTFYGGNNPVVQRLGQYWGYWVFPDEIAGETPMRELAKTMSEAEVDHYYTQKGQEFIRANWREMPLLMAGKLVRAYVPVPWKMTPGLLLVNGYRILMYALFVWGIWKYWKQTPYDYRLLVVSMLLVNVITVMGFWGCARFAFAVEPLLIPIAAMGLTKKIVATDGHR